MVIKRIRISILVISLLVFFALINLVSASSTKQRVYDYAGLLNSEEIHQLEMVAEKYSEKRETDFIILTTNDTKGKDIVPYMEDFYDEMALGYDKPHGNAAIITIDMGNRDVYLAGFYKAETYLDDNRLDMIRDKITSDLSSGDFYRAFESFIKTSYRYMGIRPGVNPENILFKLWFQLAVSLGLGGIIVGSMSHSSGGRVTVGDSTYRDSSRSSIIDKRDRFINTTVTKTKIESNNSSGGKGGGFSGGGGGRSSGGHSHSGSRGKF